MTRNKLPQYFCCFLAHSGRTLSLHFTIQHHSPFTLRYPIWTEIFVPPFTTLQSGRKRHLSGCPLTGSDSAKHMYCFRVRKLRGPRYCNVGELDSSDSSNLNLKSTSILRKSRWWHSLEEQMNTKKPAICRHIYWRLPSPPTIVTKHAPVLRDSVSWQSLEEAEDSTASVLVNDLWCQYGVEQFTSHRSDGRKEGSNRGHSNVANTNHQSLCLSV